MSDVDVQITAKLFGLTRQIRREVSEEKKSKVFCQPKRPLRNANWVSCADAAGYIPRKLFAFIGYGRTDPRVFPSVNLQDRTPSISFSAFSPGLLIACGGLSPLEALASMHKHVYQLRKKTMRPFGMLHFIIQNIVSNWSVGARINIDLFHRDHPRNTVYNPSVFSGLRLLRLDPTKRKPICILFPTGQIVCTGCDDEDEAILIKKALDNELSHYYEQDPYRILPAEECLKPAIKKIPKQNNKKGRPATIQMKRKRQRVL